jgi:hypothetical protein
MTARLLHLLPLVALVSSGCFSKDSDDDDDDDDGSTSGAPDNWGDGGSGGSGSGGGDGADGAGDGTDGTDGTDGSDGGSTSTTTAGAAVRGEMGLTDVNTGQEWVFSIEGEQIDCVDCTFAFEGTLRNDDFGDGALTVAWIDVGASYEYVYFDETYYWGWGRTGGGYAAWFPGEDWEAPYGFAYSGFVYVE